MERRTVVQLAAVYRDTVQRKQVVQDPRHLAREHVDELLLITVTVVVVYTEQDVARAGTDGEDERDGDLLVELVVCSLSQRLKDARQHLCSIGGRVGLRR